MTRTTVLRLTAILMSAAAFVASPLAAPVQIPPSGGSALTVTNATAAGAGTFPSGASFNTVALSGMRFGLGVNMASDGSAIGDFEGTLLGVAGGVARTLTVEGKAVGASSAAPGVATITGTCRIDMGDGTPALTGVPFSLTAVTGAGGKGTLSLVLGTTNLLPATITTGGLTVR